MTQEQADKTIQGDTVIYHGLPHTVNSVRGVGIAGPYFRLSCADRDCPEHHDHGLTSYKLVSLPPVESNA